jgi:1-acyl-sn-glycerol-3-phosphate acyltransferase
MNAALAPLVAQPEPQPEPQPQALQFMPQTPWQRAKFALVGRWIWDQACRSLAAASSCADGDERGAMQRLWSRRVLRHLDVSIRMRGKIPSDATPHVVVALHESLIDALCLLQLPLVQRFAARREVFAWPGIGPALANMRHTPIDPEHGARAYRQLLVAAADAHAAGEHFVVFPQGTVLGIETAFRCGAFRVAQALRAPILPVVITGTHRVWEHPFASTLRYGQTVGVEILEPVPVATVSAMDTRELCSFVEQRMKRAALSGALPDPRHFVPERDGFWDGYAYAIDPAFGEVFTSVAERRAAARSLCSVKVA